VVRFGQILGLVILFVIVVFGAWWAIYPGPDPKGFEYIGWRLGLPTLRTDEALGVMVGDHHGRNLVIGKTQGELLKRFGYLLTLDQANSYYRRYCVNPADYVGKEVFMLRQSNWMVVMQNGRAVDLVLLKGC